MKNSLRQDTTKKPKAYERQKKIYLPVFGYTVSVVVTDDLQRSRTKRNSVIGHSYTVAPTLRALHSFNNDKAKSWLFFQSAPSAGTISHECSHAVHRMFNWIGAENEIELFAYHLGYLVDECFAILYPNK